MANNQFADLHCHPVSRPYYNSTGSIWEGFPYMDNGSPKKSKLKKVLQAQKEGARGAMYDQASFPKLVNGNVNLVFIALYPLEKGFILKKPFYIEEPDPTDPFKNLVSTSRSFILSLFTKYPRKKIQEISQEEYWEQFIEEYELYRRNSTNILGDNAATIKTGSETEIKEILHDKEFALGDLINYRPQGAFTIVDGANPPDQIPTSNVMTVMTIEGMGTITQICRAQNMCYPLGIRPLTGIIDKLEVIKKFTPVFFITFCHHMDNGVCGHARSVPHKIKIAGIDQEPRISEGFTPVGKKALEYMLSVEADQDGNYHRNPAFGRRILVDMKHMSLRGRQTVIELVKNYNANNPNDKIPLISSHTGYTGLPEIELTMRVENDLEQDKTQTVKFTSKRLKTAVRYNVWSINLSTEEVRDIVDSDGLIGLSFEQNILGVPFGAKIKGSGKNKYEETRKMHIKLVGVQLCKMAEAAGKPEFWKCVGIGTDFDGLINPVDGYPSALFFELMRVDLLEYFRSFTAEARQYFFLPANDDDMTVVVDDFCFNNTRRFLQKHYDPAMPDIRTHSIVSHA